MPAPLPPRPPERFRRLPYPIVHTFELMWDVDGDWAWNLRLRRLIKCFATALQYVTILGLNDYLRQREARPDTKLDAFLVAQLRKPSLGHWARVFSSTSRHLGEGASIPQLLEFHGGARGPRRFPQHLIELRNRYVHPDIFPPEDEAQRVFEQHYPALERFLDQLDFLAEAFLVGRHSTGCLICHGPEPTTAPPALASLCHALEPGDFGVITQGPGGPELMPLSLFLWLRPAHGGAGSPHGKPYLYSHVERRGVVYILGDRTWFEDSTYGEFARLLDTLTEDEDLRALREQRRQRERHHTQPSWQHAWVQGALASHERILRDVEAARFHRELYVERTDARQEIEAFLASEQRLVLVVGGSGFGKTSFVSDLTHRLLPPPFEPERARRLALGHEVVAAAAIQAHPTVVLHHRAASIPGIDLHQLIADDLLLLPERLGEYLEALDKQRTGKLSEARLLLVFDGVNEHPQARQLCEVIRDLARAYPYPWLELIVCLRTAFWEYTRDVFMSDPGGLWVHRDELGAERPFVLLDRFSPLELERAYGLYLESSGIWDLALASPWQSVPASVRKLLRDPYLLRQYAQNYRHPPEGLVPARILMDSFGSMPPGHRAFLVRLLTQMWARGTDILDSEALESDSKLVEYYREEPYTSGFLPRCEPCKTTGAFLLEEPLEPPRCPRCKRPITLAATERRNTIDSLIDIGVIAVNRRDEAGTTVRFAHDRIFEAVSAVFLTVTHDSEELDPRARAAEILPALGRAQLRNALVLYQLLMAEYQVRDDSGTRVRTPERLYLDSRRLQFHQLHATLRRWQPVRAMLEHLLDGDDPRLTSFLVDSMVQLPGSVEWIELIFQEERTRAGGGEPSQHFQVAVQAARELGLVELLLGVLVWDRPFHGSLALEGLFHLASGSVGQSQGPFTEILDHIRRDLRGLRGLLRHRHAVKPLLELLLRIATVHNDEQPVLEALGALLVEVLSSLPLVGSRGPRWLQPIAWLGTRVLLFPASFVLVPWIKEKVEESSRKSDFLRGATAEHILTLGPDDPAKLRRCLDTLGKEEPAGDELWDLLVEFDTPQRELTSVPSVKTSMCSAIELSRLLCEGEATVPRLHRHLSRVETPHSRLTMLNLLGYYAIIRGVVSQDLLELARRVAAELHSRFRDQAHACRSFAGLENYPLFQLGIVEKAAGHPSVRGLQDYVRAAILERDTAALAYAWKNMLPAGVRWPEETLGLLAATVSFEQGRLTLRGTDWHLALPAPRAAGEVADEATILRPLQELMSAMNLVHRPALERFLERQEVDSDWRSYLLAEREHARLRRFQTTKTSTRFVNIQLNRSPLFRRWARRTFELWLKHAEQTRFRPLGRRGMVRLAFGLLRLVQDLVRERSCGGGSAGN